MYGFTLIALLAIVGGVIAYIGDKLGTKVGKKKLTLFGLRPKHTSIIVTIVTGILIVSSTMGILTLVSRDVRTALFGMEALKAQLTSLSQEVTVQNKELDVSRKALEEKNAEYAALSAKVLDTAARLRAINVELEAVKAERDQAAAELGRVQADYAKAQGDVVQYKKDISTLQQTKSELDSRVASLSSAKEQLQSDVDHLNELTANLKQGIQVVREGSIIYRAGEVLASHVVPGGEQRSDMEYALTSMMYETNQGILNRLNVADKNLEVLWISRQDYTQAVDMMLGLKQDVIVRISSAGNIVYGEPVVGRVEIFPNRRIYGSGEMIQTAVFDAAKNSKEAEETVITFLQQVNATAVKQGVLPDPLKGTVGVMSGAQLYDTVNKARKVAGSKLVLTAVADGDIYTVGPLKIDIRVQGL